MAPRGSRVGRALARQLSQRLPWGPRGPLQGKGSAQLRPLQVRPVLLPHLTVPLMLLDMGPPWICLHHILGWLLPLFPPALRGWIKYHPPDGSRWALMLCPLASHQVRWRPVLALSSPRCLRCPELLSLCPQLPSSLPCASVRHLLLSCPRPELPPHPELSHRPAPPPRT